MSVKNNRGTIQFFFFFFLLRTDAFEIADPSIVQAACHIWTRQMA